VRGTFKEDVLVGIGGATFGNSSATRSDRGTLVGALGIGGVTSTDLGTARSDPSTSGGELGIGATATAGAEAARSDRRPTPTYSASAPLPRQTRAPRDPIAHQPAAPSASAAAPPRTWRQPTGRAPPVCLLRELPPDVRLPACAEFNREVISARTQTDDQLVSGSRPRTALRRTEFDHNARDWRRATDCAVLTATTPPLLTTKRCPGLDRSHPENRKPADPDAPTAHLRLHQFAERNFHIDAVGVFQDRYAGNLRMRTARSRIRALLRDTWRCRQGATTSMKIPATSIRMAAVDSAPLAAPCRALRVVILAS